jgi:hypothetical protein
MGEDRIIEMAFRFVDGDIKTVAEWLSGIGAKIERRDERELIFRGPSGITTGLAEGIDPISAAVCIATAIAGLFWPFAFPSLLERVNAEWRRRMKTRK